MSRFERILPSSIATEHSSSSSKASTKELKNACFNVPKGEPIRIRIKVRKTKKCKPCFAPPQFNPCPPVALNSYRPCHPPCNPQQHVNPLKALNSVEPSYKINFKDNQMNVNSNIDFLVKKIEQTMSMAENDPSARRFLIKPVADNLTPVTVTIRPNQEYLQQQALIQQQLQQLQQQQPQGLLGATEPQVQPNYTLQVQQPQAQNFQYSPEQAQAAFQQQYQQNPQSYQFSPEQVRAAFEQQLQQNPQLQQDYRFTPEQVQAAFQQQQQQNPQVAAGNYQFTPEQISAAFAQQQQQQQQPQALTQPAYSYQQQLPQPTLPYAQAPAEAYPYSQQPAQTQQ